MVVYPREQSLGIGVNIMTPEYDVAMVDWRCWWWPTTSTTGRVALVFDGKEILG